jgi:hypothetical protein
LSWKPGDASLELRARIRPSLINYAAQKDIA